MDSKGSINLLTILEWRNGVVKEWVMDSEVEEPSIGVACSAMIHRFKCIPGWVHLVKQVLVVQVAFFTHVTWRKFFEGFFNFLFWGWGGGGLH